MRHPLVIPTLLYIAGVLLGDRWALSLPWLFGTSFALLLVALVWARARKVALALLLVAAGWTNQVCQTAVLSPHDVRRLAPEPALATVRGVLVETPVHRIFDRGEEEVWRTLAVIQVTQLRLGREDWTPAVGRVAATTPGVLDAAYFGGQSVEVEGVLSPPRGPNVPGQFDHATHLRRRGVARQLRTLSTNDWRVLSAETVAPKPTATTRFAQWARGNLARGVPEDESVRLLWAMSLGWRTALTGEVSQPFMRSGTMHIFAISGLHVALIAGILVALLRVSQVSRGWCGVVVIPLLWFYAAATGWQSSAVRASVMMTVVILGWSLRRPWDLLNSLAAAALIILLVQPGQLFLASFQLSFAVVVSLALFAPLFERVTRGWVDPDPLQPAEVRSRGQQAALSVGYYLAGNFSVALAAWVGSLPLIAYYFHLLTPSSLLANLLVVPLAGLALMACLGSVLTGWAVPGIAVLFNHAAWLFMSLMVWLSESIAGLPGAWFRVPAPTGLDFACYYAVVIAVLSGALRRSRWRWWFAAGLLVLGGACVTQHVVAARVTRMAVIPISGGHVVHARGPGGAADVLVDVGNASGFEFTLAPYLTWAGENRPRRLVLTHGDIRQVGGAELAMQQFPPREIITSPLRFRSPAYRAMIEAPWFPAERRRIAQAGDSIGVWRVLHPSAEDRFQRADDATLVLAGELGGVRVLLMNDLGRPGQEVLQQRTPAEQLRADIVVAGLPADGEPLGNALLEIVRPQLILIADNETPATRRTGAALRGRLEARGVPVLYTREGALLLGFKSGSWTISRADGQRVAQGMRSQSP